MEKKTLDEKLNDNMKRVKEQLVGDSFAESLLRQKRENDFLGEYGKIKALLSSNSEQLEGSLITYQETSNLLRNIASKTSGSELNRLEMLNHFKLFDYMLETYSQPLSKELFFSYHKILKEGVEKFTAEEEKKYVRIGRFKSFDNTIGGVIPTVSPEEVEDAIDKLLFEYEYIKAKSLEDITDFHFRFESIHPFYDGNGRIGRIVMFKECLANNITPFIISNLQRAEYGKALREYPIDKDLMLTLCQDAQNEFKKVMGISTKKHEKIK